MSTERKSMRDLVKAMDDATLEVEIQTSEAVVARLTGTHSHDGKMQLLVAQCHLMAVRSERTLRNVRTTLGHPARPVPAPLPSNVISLSQWKANRSKT